MHHNRSRYSLIGWNLEITPKRIFISTCKNIWF